MSTALGVDGAAKGWVFVALDDGRFRSAELHPRFADGLAAHPEAEVVAVDIPIGLPDTGTRRADLEAKALLRGKAPSVFLTPPRAVLSAANYPESSKLCRQLSGRGLSKQSYSLFPKILEVDAVDDPRLREVHPEVSFARLAGEPVAESKRSWTGVVRRRALLAGAGVELPDDLGDAGRLAAADDVLDAAVAAWSAARIAARQATSLPTRPEVIDGREVAIWA
jgi:predicted RNase H-like nuclease